MKFNHLHQSNVQNDVLILIVFLQAGEFFTEMQPIFHPDDKMYLDLLEILYEQLLSKGDYRGTLEANLQILQHYHRYGNNGYGVSNTNIKLVKLFFPKNECIQRNCLYLFR